MANFDKSIIVKLKLNVRGWLNDAAKLDRSTEQFNKSLREMQKVSTKAFGTAERHAASASKKFAKLEEKTKGLQQAVTRHAAAAKKQAAALAKLTAKLKKNTTANTAAARVSKSASKAEKNKIASAKKAANELSAIEKKHLAEALRHIGIRHDFAKRSNRMRVADEKRIASKLEAIVKQSKNAMLADEKRISERLESIDKKRLDTGLREIKLKQTFVQQANKMRVADEKITSERLEAIEKKHLADSLRHIDIKHDFAKQANRMRVADEKRIDSRLEAATKQSNRTMERVIKERIDYEDRMGKRRVDRHRAFERRMAELTTYYTGRQKREAKGLEKARTRSNRIAVQEAKRLKRVSIDAANASIRWRKNVSKFNRGLIGGLGNAASSIRQFEIVFDAVFNGRVKEAIQSFATFDAGIRKGLGLLPRAEQDFDAVRASLEKLRKEFGVEGVQATDAYYKALSNGLTSGQALKALPIAAKAAIATQAELADVIKVGTDVINATSAELKDLPAIYNAMTSAVRLGQTTMGEFATKLGDVLPLSDKLGVKLSTVLSILATMTKQGVSTSIALTRVRRLFVALAAPTKNAAAEFDEFGITAQVAKIKSEGLLPVLELIQQKTGGNTAALKKLAPNMRALLPLVQLLRDGLTSYKVVNDSLVLSAKDLDTAFKTNAESIDLVIKKMEAAKDIGFEKMGEDMLRFGQAIGVANRGIKGSQKTTVYWMRGIGQLVQAVVAAFLSVGHTIRWIGTMTVNGVKLGYTFVKTIVKMARDGFKAAYMWVGVGIGGVAAGLAKLQAMIMKTALKIPFLGDSVRKSIESGAKSTGEVADEMEQKLVRMTRTTAQALVDLGKPIDELTSLIRQQGKENEDYIGAYSAAWDPMIENARLMNEEWMGRVRLTQEATKAIKEYDEAIKKASQDVVAESTPWSRALGWTGLQTETEAEKKLFKLKADYIETLGRLAATQAAATTARWSTMTNRKKKGEEAAEAAAALAAAYADAEADIVWEREEALFEEKTANILALQKAKVKADEEAEKARLEAVKAEAKDRVKREKAELKSIDKLIKAQQKLYDKRSGKDVDLSGLTIDSKELNDLDPMAIAEQFGSFQLSSLRSQQKIFVNENLVLVRKLTESGFRVFFQESEAALAARRGTFKSATEQATDGIVDGLKTLADQISPIVAQLTFESDKLGREALRKSDAALRASPFFNQGAGGLGARAQADFSLRTGAFAGFNAGGSVGLKRYGNGGTTTPLPNTDSVPALLTPGEFVINRESAGAFLPLLQRINRTPSGRVSNDNSSSTQNNTFNFSGGNSISPDQVKRDIIPVIRAQERMGRK